MEYQERRGTRRGGEYGVLAGKRAGDERRTGSAAAVEMIWYVLQRRYGEYEGGSAKAKCSASTCAYSQAPDLKSPPRQNI